MCRRKFKGRGGGGRKKRNIKKSMRRSKQRNRKKRKRRRKKNRGEERWRGRERLKGRVGGGEENNLIKSKHLCEITVIWPGQRLHLILNHEIRTGFEEVL